MKSLKTGFSRLFVRETTPDIQSHGIRSIIIHEGYFTHEIRKKFIPQKLLPIRYCHSLLAPSV